MIFNTIFILVCFYLGFKAGNYMISKKKQMIITPKDRFCKKAYQLSKVVKPVIGCKWHKLYNQEQKDILLDICYMPEDLIEFLLIDKFTCQDKDCIKDHYVMCFIIRALIFFNVITCLL